MRHARKRIQQRFGLPVSTEETQRLAADIAGRRALHLWNQSPTRSWYAVRIGERVGVVVFHPRAKVLVTVLTEEQARYTLRREMVPSGWERWVLPKRSAL